MNNEKNYDSEQSCPTRDVTAAETQTGNGSMIVGVSHRLAGMFSREEEDYDLPEDFKPRNDDYDWLGVD